MNIVIVAVSSAAHLSGVSRHAANVARCLLTRSEVTAVHLLTAPWQHEPFHEAISRSDTRLLVHSVPIGSGTLTRNLWHYTDLPAIAAQLEADVVHLSYPMPLRGGAFHCPTVVTLHDLYPYDIPENFGFPKVLYNRLALWQCLQAVDAIACVSDSTLQRLGKLNKPLLAKALRVYNSVEPSTSRLGRNPLPQWRGEPFFLCVAQHRRNKNLVLTLNIFQRLLRNGTISSAAMLVIVGMTGPETRQIHRFIRTAGLSGKIVLLSGIHDAEMQWLYRNCELLLAPSIVEGFGLPVAEALLAGCRIVCSDIPAFRELGAHAACHYVSLGPAAEEAFAETICTALREPRRAPPALRQLSAPVIAEEYMRLYRGLLFARATSSHSHPISRHTVIQKGRIS
ncbi:MAG TPA: glycosyltransferase family 1 protein [Alloacidobacterium sp.]|jgi:glycosyltransferase involved in cell wall biosynthesis|nr:glycosyltransferase family 1 protein [Alloacidobacterium sp.]